MTEFDASFLRLTEDSSPVKVTFLNASPSGHHLFGYFFTDRDGRFGEAKLLFPKVHRDTLISSVSAVFLSARAVAGRTLCFFAVEKGFDENSTVPCFQDVVFGRNGTLRFFENPNDSDAVPVLEQGVPVWKSADGKTRPAVCATTTSDSPVPVWQGTDATLSLLSGTVSFSLAGALFPTLNAAGAAQASLTPEDETFSFVMSFKKASETLVSVRLNVGKRNFDALVGNRIGCRLMPDIPADACVSNLKATAMRGDIVLDGFEQAETIAAGNKKLTVTRDKTTLCVSGDMDAALATALANRMHLNAAADNAVTDDVSLVVTVNGVEKCKTAAMDVAADEEKQDNAFSILSTLSDTVDTPLKTTALNVPVADEFPVEYNADPLPSFLFEKEPHEAVLAASPVAEAVVKPLSHKRKTVLVTGGAKRIGRAVCETMAAKGWNVVVHCHESMAEAGRLVDDLKNRFGIEAIYVRADLSDMDETARLIPSVVDSFGSLDALVNAAAVFVKDGVTDCTPDSFEENMAVNMRAPFFLTQAFARFADKSDAPAVVNLLDQRVLNPTPYFMSYTLSKAGLALLTRTTALALAPHVRVNGIALGDVLPAAGQPKHDFDRRVASTPLKKAVDVDTVAQTVAFLLENPNMTGVVLPLDSGQSLNWSPEK